jgi:alpha-tubulin suppressor-like RCC1 family protein
VLSGHEDNENRSRPTLVSALWAEGIVSISAGDHFSAAVSLAGRVFTWGRAKYGQLGRASPVGPQPPAAVPLLSSIIQVLHSGPCCGRQSSLPLPDVCLST